MPAPQSALPDNFLEVKAARDEKIRLATRPEACVFFASASVANAWDPWVYRPGIYVKNMMRDGINDKATFYTDTEESSHLRGRKSIVPCANILGGGSSINFQMYTRASASDWDDFNQPGWEAKNLLPLMKRIENYQKPCNNDTHGKNGPISISNGGQITPLAQDFLRAAHEIGIPYTDDLQDLDTANGAEIWAKYISAITGRRSDAAHGYIHPVRAIQKNLHLRCNAKASRVIFEGNKAVGVAYVSPRNHGHQSPKETIIMARKLVVLSSGTLSTPQATLLSWSALELEAERSFALWAFESSRTCREWEKNTRSAFDASDIKVLLTLRHRTTTLRSPSSELRKTPSPSTTSFAETKKRRARFVPLALSTSAPSALSTCYPLTLLQQAFNSWEITPQKSLLASNAIDAGFKLRPTEAELAEMGPEFQDFFEKYFRDKPDKPGVTFLRLCFIDLNSESIPTQSCSDPSFTMFNYLEYPASRGRIHIASKNPHVEPTFDSGFMNDKADFAPIRWGYKKTREIARRMDGKPLDPEEISISSFDFKHISAYRGDLTSHHPHYHPTSKAKTFDVDIVTAKQILPEGLTVGIHMGTWSRPAEPVLTRPKVKEDIQYTKEDDDAIDDWIADHVETTWHSLGTCAMKPRDVGGVLDHNLNVYGTKNLKVAEYAQSSLRAPETLS
ncbi:hypothetical protein P7C70_g2739, partial [Phenoliferia sp. Uapishka_3]